jgi:hypothetical protein
MISLDDLIKQKQFKDSYEISDKNEVEQINFIFDLANKTCDDKLLTLFDNLRIIITNLPLENFDEICIKYLTLLNENYKKTINKDIYTNIDLELLIILNKCFTGFYIHFMKNFQNYNEKHKSVIKVLPNFLKIFFNLLNEKVEILKTNLNIIDSFFVSIISLLNYFPNMIRSYENKIDKVIKTVLMELIYKDLDVDINKSCLKSLSITYGMLIRLSTDPNAKLKTYIKSLRENIESYIELFKPKTMKTIKNKSDRNFDNLIFGPSFKQTNVIVARNIINILFLLVRYTVKSLQRNINIDIDIASLFELILLGLSQPETAVANTNDYVIEGLGFGDFKIFSQYYYNNLLRLCKFLIKNFSEYIYFSNENIKEIISKLLISEQSYFENYILSLEVMRSVVQYFDLRCKSKAYEIIFKFSYNNFIDVLISYLERNDKTIVKVDQKYFKLATLKKNKTSLIQLARQEAYNTKLDRLTNCQLNEIILKFFDGKLNFYDSFYYLFPK